jgi:endonuclease/exonuclease/phosphatase family metal-dependent hydrolase
MLLVRILRTGREIVRPLVRSLGRTAARRIALLAAVTGLLVAVRPFHGCTSGLRVGTYNIRRFGHDATDLDRLTLIVRDLQADVLALQEIEDEAAVADLARRASVSGRRYRHVLSACGGRSDMRVGFLYDEERVVLRSTREFPELDPDGGGQCDRGERAGLLGVFAPRGRAGDGTLSLLVIHFLPGGEPEQVARRKQQWARAHRILAALRASGTRDIAILGDTNSTDYLDGEHGEREAIDRAARDAGMIVATSDLACSEYWHKGPSTYAPSLLDHVVATPGLLESQSARVHGYCADLRCKPLESHDPPDEFSSVSDHCPVTVELNRERFDPR